MWCLYRFTRAAKTDRSADLSADIYAFAQAIVQQPASAGIWIKATACVGGGVDIWFSIPVMPADPVLATLWQEQLHRHGLAAQRLTNRS